MKNVHNHRTIIDILWPSREPFLPVSPEVAHRSCSQVNKTSEGNTECTYLTTHLTKVYPQHRRGTSR
jgi:hypothetical protein